EVQNAVKEDPTLNKKVLEATKAYTRNSTNLSELLTLVKNYDLPGLKTIVDPLIENTQAHIQSDIASLRQDISEIKNMMTKILCAFKGQSYSTPSSSVPTSTLAITEGPATIWRGGSSAHTATITPTEETPSYNEGEKDEMVIEEIVTKTKNVEKEPVKELGVEIVEKELVQEPQDEVPSKSKNDMSLRDKSVETKYPAIAFNDQISSEKTLSCEPTVSPLNDNEIDFRISFDDSDDEDYMVIYDKNSFSYKIIFVDNLKTDLENDNDKVNMPSFSSPEVNFLTEATVSPQHIDEFNLKDETSLSECDEEEENVLNFHDLFPFNVIYPNDSKSDKDNDDDKVDIEHSSGDLSVKPLPDVINTDVGAYAHGSNKLLETNMTPLPHRDQRHPWLGSVNRVHILDLAGLTEGMRQTLAGRLRMVYTRGDGQELFTSHTMSDTEMGLDVADTLCFQLGGARPRWFEAYWLGSERVIPDKGDLRDYWIKISSDKDFLGPTPSYVYIRDPVREFGTKMISLQKSFWQKTGHLKGADTIFLSKEAWIQRTTSSISVSTSSTYIRRLNRYMGLVSPGLERQPDAMAGALSHKNAPAVNEVIRTDLAPMQHLSHHMLPPGQKCLRGIRARGGGARLHESILGLARDVNKSIT
ncbi:hypothetical protein Tco_0483815, partial [Tanacetum coccineum]